MAFDDSPTTTGSRYLGEGFRHEPDFRDSAGAPTFEAAPVPAAEVVDPVLVPRRTAPPNLDYVFDDPAHGEPGRDRMLVHGLWELLLVLVLAGAGYLLYRHDAGLFSGDALRRLLLGGAVLGAFTLATVVALRAGVPNLAVGAVGAAAGIQFAHSDGGPLWPLLVVLGLCAALGAAQGLVIVGLHVPAWAVSLGLTLLLLAWAARQSVSGSPGGYDPMPHAYYWFGGFCAVSIIGGLVTLVPALRRASGRFRPVADPAHRRGLIAALIALVATIVSAVLAGTGGVLAVASSGRPSASAAIEVTGLALGAALLGGTSAYGRRGGIFGTVLAVALIVVGMRLATESGRDWGMAVFAAIAIGIGLAVTRLVERFGRPAPGVAEDEDEEDWAPRVHSTASRSWPSATEPATAEPAPTATSGGLWASDEAWGTMDRR